MKCGEYAPWSYCLRVRPGAYPRVGPFFTNPNLLVQHFFISLTFFHLFNTYFISQPTFTDSVYLQQFYFNSPNFSPIQHDFNRLDIHWLSSVHPSTICLCPINRIIVAYFTLILIFWLGAYSYQNLFCHKAEVVNMMTSRGNRPNFFHQFTIFSSLEHILVEHFFCLIPQARFVYLTSTENVRIIIAYFTLILIFWLGLHL